MPATVKKKGIKTKTLDKTVSINGKNKKINILFFRIGETEFCVKRDDLIDITGGNIIYHLPLTPAYFDGVVDLNGTTTTVFDLGPLIDIPSSKSSREGILLVVSKKPAAAFRIDEIIDELTLAQEAYLPMPGYLKSDFIDTCVIKGEELIPLINLNKIIQSILSGDLQKSTPCLHSSSSKLTNKKISVKTISHFVLGEDSFATDEFDPLEPPFKIKNISIIPAAPDFVRGISLFKNLPITVIDTSRRLNLDSNKGNKILIAKIGKDLFGFIVDEVKKQQKAEKIKILQLPELTRKTWMTAAIQSGKNIIPMLNLTKLISPEEPIEQDSLAERYRPDSSFEQRFFKEDIKITEFILMGKHHALPSDEVKEVISLKHYRRLPALPSIVIGVSEHEGVLLPVIDIEACFGVKSQITKSWKMIHVENGNFSALVLTKVVLDEKPLPADLHRKMPVLMKHKFIYGCYPNNEAKMISLALNVYKMAVYFDEEMLREVFSPTISPAEKDKKPIVELNNSDLLSTPAKEVFQASDDTQTQIEAPTPTKNGIQENDLETKQGSSGDQINTELNKTYNIVPSLSPIEKLNISMAAKEGSQLPGESDDEINRSGVKPKSVTIASNFSTPTENSRAKNNFNAEKLNANTSRNYVWLFIIVFLLICATLFSFFWPDTNEIITRQKKQQKAATPAKENNYSAREFKKDTIQARIKKVLPEIPTKAIIETVPGSTKNIDTKNDFVKRAINEEIIVPASVISAAPLSIPHTEEVTPEKKVVIETQKPKKWKRNKNKYYPPLGKFDFYTVEEGDTLWDIAEAYSKNPYDYNLVAEDNKIITPNLIYPGQKLRLQKKIKRN